VAGFAAFIDPDNVGWRLMFGFAAIPAVIQFFGFMFLPESPRWLFVNGEEKQSRSVSLEIKKAYFTLFQVLKKIYGKRNDWVEFELAEIAVVHEQEQASREKNEGKCLAIEFDFARYFFMNFIQIDF
jgi:SP family myo-inositol transporter-like MFS transporter 13